MPDTPPEFKSARDWHIYLVYQDPDFITDVNALKELERKLGDSPKLAELQQEVAAEWRIDPYHVFRYRVGEIIPLPAYETSGAKLIIDPFKGEFSIKFEPFTTRVEMLEQWAAFERFRADMFPAQPTKRKPPEQPELVYAIFKALKHDTDSEVFERYRSGALPPYTGSTSQFSNYSDLIAYYNRYRP